VHNYSNSSYQLHSREQENETIKQTLIVTGNGFDLQCGLKSSYYDFFSWCELNIKGFKNLKNARNSTFNSQGLIQGAFENNPNLTIWDLYFTYKSTLTNNKWCDIEFEINESIQSGFWNSIISDINYFQENGNWSYPNEDWFFAWMMNDRYYSNNNWMHLNSGFPNDMIKTVQVSNDDFYSKLLLELNIFEKRFSSYMEEELKRNTDFHMNQSNLLNKLVKSTTNNDEYSVLTFNYTPYSSEYKKNMVASNLAGKCEIGIAYAIGIKEPVSISVKTFGTSDIDETNLLLIIQKVFNFKPKAITQEIGISNFYQLASYGHVGVLTDKLHWEKLDKVEILKKITHDNKRIL